MKYLSIPEVKLIAHQLAQALLSGDEPIPDFNTRYPNVLERCLDAPRQSFYSGLVKKSAILFYLMIKNHPFQNGNKRIAMTALLTFLYLNKRWLKVDQRDFYIFALGVADSPAIFKTEIVKAVEVFIKKYLVPLHEN
ncbi:type II toxin-antitoxin system death-on-curing family toxin [Candidatus Falkowbacteria bacterium]|nr:type II toxin-antitoxin system death-on-curing family toxin [Candidatus Falkowbacteria bacterium]